MAQFQWWDRTGTVRVDRRYVQGGTVVSLVGGDVTTVGSLVTYCELAQDGRAIPAIISLTVSAKDTASPTHTCTITVWVHGEKGPYVDRVITGVVCDASTIVPDVYPGVDFKFSSSSSLANGWTTVVYIGLWAQTVLRAGNPSGVQWAETDGVEDPGVISVDAGDPSAKWTVMLKNGGATAADGCVLKRYPALVLYDKAGPRAIKSIQAVSDAPTESAHPDGQLRPYKLRVQNRTGGVGDLEYSAYPWSSWATFNVRDTSTGDDITTEGIAFDDETKYVVTEANGLEGAMLVLDSGADDTSVENVTVYGVKYFEMGLTDDPAVYETEELAVSEEGRSDQVFTPSGAVLITFQIAIDALASPKQNPFCVFVTVEYSDIGEADLAA